MLSNKKYLKSSKKCQIWEAITLMKFNHTQEKKLKKDSGED